MMGVGAGKVRIGVGVCGARERGGLRGLKVWGTMALAGETMATAMALAGGRRAALAAGGTMATAMAPAGGTGSFIMAALSLNYCHYLPLSGPTLRSSVICITIFPSKAMGLLHPLPPSKELWEQVAADFIVKLPESQGYDTVLVAANWHTKRVNFIPSVSSVSAEGSTWLFRDHV
jgi:hypothetical protein